LEYRTKDGQWNSVPLSPALKGEKRFAPGTPTTVELRMQIKDVAGNTGFAPAEVAGTPMLASNAPPSGNPANGPTATAPSIAPPPAAGPPAITQSPIVPPMPPETRTNPPGTNPPGVTDGPRDLPPPRPFPSDRIAPPPAGINAGPAPVHVDANTRLV